MHVMYTNQNTSIEAVDLPYTSQRLNKFVELVGLDLGGYETYKPPRERHATKNTTDHASL